MRFQRVLLRLLLLVLCLNSTVGMALHSADHLGGHAATAALAPLAGDEPAGGEGSSGSGESEEFGACDHCRAYAALGLFLDAPGPLAPPPLAGTEPRRVFAPGFVPHAESWRFAARDPPQAAV